ncbi:MAG TPA: TIGR03087 family PEP-CTERM/XrtA system glycosyltransferase [Planctomycetota bacterium]|nr:TIGR03087 family PEP-CTERM/XrtA system glycosyltransferase [Planctomycetota bacterium]
MRVLLLVHRVPYPPDKGDKIVSWRVLEALTAAHEVDLVTLVDDPADFGHLDVLLRRCASAQLLPLRPWAARARAAAALLGKTPLSVAWFAERAARAATRFVLERRPPEVVVLFSSQTAAWLPAGYAGPVVADLVDVDSEKWAQYGAEHRGPKAALYRLEAERLRAFERRIGVRPRTTTVLTTEREARVFRERVADVPVEVVHIGVVAPPAAPSPSERESGLMTFVGAMDYPANVEAVETGARRVLPRIRERVPHARFRIVGRKPADAVRALASLPGVEVTGAVPDPAPHVRAASLSLVPLRVARGIQNKVLEAMAQGTPVVATPPVAESLGLDPDGGGVIAVGRDEAETAARAVELLLDPEAAARLGAAGREFVTARFRWDAFSARILELVARAAGRDPSEPTRRRLPETVGEPAL